MSTLLFLFVVCAREKYAIFTKDHRTGIGFVLMDNQKERIIKENAVSGKQQ